MPAIGQSGAPAFRKYTLRDGLLPDRLKVASIHVGHTVPFWGPALVEMLPHGALGNVADTAGTAGTACLGQRRHARPHLVRLAARRGIHNPGLAGVDDPFDFVLPQRPDLGPVPGRAVIALEVALARLEMQRSRTRLTLTAIAKRCPRLRVVRILRRRRRPARTSPHGLPSARSPSARTGCPRRCGSSSEHDGRWFDLLRTGAPQLGFASRDEALADRTFHLHCVRRMFEQIDVFVFTLGPTECWQNAESGHSDPVCPGTVRGTCQPGLHRFHNFSCTEWWPISRR